MEPVLGVCLGSTAVFGVRGVQWVAVACESFLVPAVGTAPWGVVAVPVVGVCWLWGASVVWRVGGRAC